MSTNRERAELILFDLMNRDEDVSNAMFGDEYVSYVSALADARLLRPDPSSRYDGDYQTTFCRDEEAEDGPHIEASVDKHHPAPKWEIVHRADVSIDIGGEHGYHNLHAHATAEWCREAAAVLLDVADEVDRKNKETAAADHAEEVGTDGQDD